MEELTIEILDKLNKFWEDDSQILKTKKISLGDLIFALLSTTNLIQAAGLIGISSSAMEKGLIRVFPNRLIGSRWSAHLGLLVSKKKCCKCLKYRSIEEFTVATKTPTGKRYECKNCFKELCSAYHIIHKEKRNKESKNYYEFCPSKNIARNAKRRARLLNAVVPWSEMKEIEKFFKYRQKGYHVDHVIPLCHNMVCGLHVLSNLQYLTSLDNLRKANKFKTDWE